MKYGKTRLTNKPPQIVLYHPAPLTQKYHRPP